MSDAANRRRRRVTYWQCVRSCALCADWASRTRTRTTSCDAAAATRPMTSRWRQTRWRHRRSVSGSWSSSASSCSHRNTSSTSPPTRRCAAHPPTRLTVRTHRGVTPWYTRTGTLLVNKPKPPMIDDKVNVLMDAGFAYRNFAILRYRRRHIIGDSPTTCFHVIGYWAVCSDWARAEWLS